jgi:hypothetical protein
MKVVFQLVFGRHAISSGETTISALNSLPGPSFEGLRWIVWSWFGMMLIKFVHLSGITGATALVLSVALPNAPLTVTVFIVAAANALIVARGYYRFLQNLSVAFVGLFSIVTICCTVALQWTSFAFSWRDLIEGLSFQLPEAGLAAVLGAFGITGVGGDEVMQYPYWCIEKGYAAYAGPPEDKEEWLQRVKGWTRVMYLDAMLSMVVYATVTSSFYLLGAAVLHGTGDIPGGMGVVDSLSSMYTETLGPGARLVFFIGAVSVLFSSAFASLAGWTRQFSDFFGRLGLFDFDDTRARWRFIAGFAWIVGLAQAVLFLTLQAPVFMILLGGIGASFVFLLVIVASIHFRYRRWPAALKPRRWEDVWLWIAAVLIGSLVFRVIISGILDLTGF